MIHKVLRAAHGKGRDDEHAAAPDRFADDLRQLLARLVHRPVMAAAVGAFGDEHIRSIHHCRVAQDGRAVASHIARKGQALGLAVFGDFQRHRGRAEDVPGIAIRQADARQDFGGTVVLDRAEQAQCVRGIRERVQRLDGRQPLFGVALVHELGIGFLDVGRVAQHGAAQVTRGRGRVDGLVKAVLDQRGQIARVINVRVRKHHRVNGRHVERQLLVALARFLPPPLEHPTVQQNPMPVRLDQVHRAGDRLGRAPKLQFHFNASTNCSPYVLSLHGPSPSMPSKSCSVLGWRCATAIKTALETITSGSTPRSAATCLRQARSFS